MADKRYNNKLQAIMDYSHNAPYMQIGLEESPISTSAGLIKAGIGSNPTKKYDRLPRSREEMRDLVKTNPNVFPKMAELLKIAGTAELNDEGKPSRLFMGGALTDGNNTDFSNKSVARDLASCGHSGGAPYCNHTAKLGAKKAGDMDVYNALTGGSQTSYDKMTKQDSFESSDRPYNNGEYIQMVKMDGKFGHTITGIYDLASDKAYSIEGNSIGLDPNTGKKIEGIVENYQTEKHKGDKFLRKSKAREMVNR